MFPLHQSFIKMVQEREGKGIKWSSEETNYLEMLLGDYPFGLIVKYYQKWATENGWPARSRTSISDKIARIGKSKIPVGEYITSGTLKSLLNVGSKTIGRWTSDFLPAESYTGDDSRITGEKPGKRYFKRKEIVKLARCRPELFAGTSKDNLFLLLEDEELAEQISQKYPRRIGRDPRPVVCVETGKRYSSVTEAAKEVYVTKNAIFNAMRKNRTAAGYHWRSAV